MKKRSIYRYGGWLACEMGEPKAAKRNAYGPATSSLRVADGRRGGPDSTVGSPGWLESESIIRNLL